MKIKIFYSWQLTTDSKFNKNFISDCIKNAIKKINQMPEFNIIDFEVIDAVRGESGQIAIADTIIEKIIPNSDIFIADLSSKKVNKLVSFFFKNKPTPNPNVMTEYGVALNSLGKQRIVSVLNTNYNGSPTEKNNSEIIPFDLRQDRFPTEYSFSRRNESKKNEIKKFLVDGLVHALKPTIQNVLETQKSKFRPFVAWNEWNTSLKNPPLEKFITNRKIKDIQTSILTSINNRSAIRLLGLSGLGKSRILFETFRPILNDNTSLLFTNRILYVNCYDYPNKINFADNITKIKGEKDDAILIVDNCDISTHKLIIRNLNGLSLITIDSNPEENSSTEDTNYIKIGKHELSDIVTQLVDNDFKNVGQENVAKIKNFSQGIPLMAVLLGESVKNGEHFIGKLNNKDLLDTLLGSKGKEEKYRTILKSCSIFNYFGFYDELATQTEFIAKSKNITSLNGDDKIKINDFNETCKYYLKREIFERKGRFIGMRPFPLAMSLAQEWLDPLTPKRLIDVINEIADLNEPDRKGLSNSFAEQMKYLGYDEKAVQIVEKIIGPGSPFDNAEVLNTELGSRLFRSFVEVNPVAVSENLIRVFSKKSTKELLEIVEGRRNLVWVLEKLCFDKRTFEKSTKLLFSFSIAENETWANNATGQLVHLFNIHLSGTEANLTQRWKIIEWALKKEDGNYFELAIKAMKAGLNFGHFSRTSGAESQGSKRLYDYNPSWEEIEEYWKKILNKLLDIVKSKNEYSDSASEIIANSVRAIYHAQMGEIIIPVLKEITELKNKNWNEGLKALQLSRKYEKNLISKGLLKETNNLIESLKRTDFSTRYLSISSSYHLDNDEPYSSDKVMDAMIQLADEFIKKKVSWEETFPSFFKNQQVFSYHFGKRISELLKDNITEINRFIDFSLETISHIPIKERNYIVLGGFISNSEEEIKKKFYLRLLNINQFSCQLFYFLSLDKTGKKYIDFLFNLIDKNVCELSNFYSFSYSDTLSNLNLDELNTFSEKLFNYGDEGYALVFDLFFDIGYRNESIKNSLEPIYKKCIIRLGINRSFKRQLDDYKWSEAISQILSHKNEIEFAQFINKSVIHSISSENLYHLDHSIQKIYVVLMKMHFESIWNDLSEALLSNEDSYLTFYGLKHILGSRVGGVGRSVGILFEGDIDSIFNWCEKNKPLAPARLAELVPIYNDDSSNWHPIALKLLDEFGDIEDVLRSLSSNMGTFSWVGSLVPLLEAKKDLLNEIKNHEVSFVAEWANRFIEYTEEEIKREKTRDEEMFI